MILRTTLLLLAFMVSTSYASTQKQIYVVHMDKDKIKSPDITKKWYESVLDSIDELSVNQEEEKSSPPDLLYVYETTMFGFSATLTPNQLESLKKINGFLDVFPDEMLTIHTTHSPQFLGLKPGKGLWSPKNVVSDIIIGVLDTGIWPEHVSFSDIGMPPVPSNWKGTCKEGTKFTKSNCNKKIIGARAYFKAYESAAGRINETTDYRSPRDSDGHGTHTASTAAGNLVREASLLGNAKGTASGVMYAARIAVYKVCYQLGCSSSDILAAMDQAVSDGVNILSLSLGGSTGPYYRDEIAIASFGAIRKGVFYSCSAGNLGPDRSSVVNVAPWMMTVAASYIDRSFPTKVKLGNGEIFEGASLYSGKNVKDLPIAYGKNAGGRGAEYCIGGSLSPKLVKGKMVVCQQGFTDRTEKGEQVKSAGGAAMLLINTEIEGEELIADPHILPATSLGAIAGNAIKNYVKQGNISFASIMFEGTKYGTPAPIMAAFSSRGPSLVGPDVIKPDVTGPGVNILAAWQPNVGPTELKSDKRSVLFNIISGTSMSCPHVSALAALLKSVHKNWSPAAIKSALMTTGYTLDNRKSPIADAGSAGSSAFATPFAFGSGHVDPEKAVDPGLIYDITLEDYQNYFCSLKYTSSQLSILWREKRTCPKDSILLQPGNLNYPSFAVLFSRKSQSVTHTYNRTVTNVGKAKRTYTVQVTEPSGVAVNVEPKKLKFSSVGEKLSYEVKFTKLSDRGISRNSSFGFLMWVSGKYEVRSPIAVTWQ